MMHSVLKQGTGKHLDELASSSKLRFSKISVIPLIDTITLNKAIKRVVVSTKTNQNFNTNDLEGRRFHH